MLKENQIGFLKGHRTSDHTFVVNTLINKIVKGKGTQLFSAFIDLRKAYDSVCRPLLFKMLWEYGFEGPFLTILKSMYGNVKQSIKLQNVLIEPIATTLGLKQGCNLSPLLFNLFIDDLGSEFDSCCDQVSLDGFNFSHLLYADDLILLSNSAQGLQTCLDRLLQYCSKWNLKVNLKKSNIVIFNKTGRIPRDITFSLGGDEMMITNKYKYLGTVLSSSGSFNPAIENLADKARKAYFSLRPVLSKFDFDTDLSLKLFDSMLKPILTYNTEVWFQLSPRQLKRLDQVKDYEQFFFDTHLNEIESQHMRFCKNTLGLNKSASNIATLGELGRLPLKLICYRQALLYFHRLLTLEDSTLVKKAFNDSIVAHKNGQFSWISSIQHLFRLFNMHFDIRRLSLISCSRFRHIVDKAVKGSFESFWRKRINSSVGPSKSGGNKLRHYNLFKCKFQAETYTKLKDKSLVKSMAKLRCSNHNLRIETGRRDNTPPELRYCRLCNTQEVENEQHFLVECRKYGVQRKQLFETAENEVKSFSTMNPKQKFIYLLSTENIKLVQEVAKYARDAFESRNNSLNNGP